MKISLEWLNEYVNLEGLTREDISHALTMVGFEVEGIEEAGLPQLNKVVVGEILSFGQHPNADRLSVCEVDVGGENPQTIVCGAKNFRQNDRVLAALPGAVLPGNFKIKKSKLRGVVSKGMLCSEKELGLGDDHAGIAILDSRPPIGTPVNELYPEPDLVFDVEITPNRPDALSHLGIARELAAWFKRELRYPTIRINASEASEGHLVDKLECTAPERCPHYRGYSVRGVAVDESPDWLKRRLKAIGLRPINNIVDATNYILHETGQPLHAFDVAKIRGPRIIVRQAREKETLTTLDDQKRTLEADDLVIADAERALVVAGVMGSVDAEVDAETRDLFLEAAWFSPAGIRRSSRRLGLSTDSSYRFERGVDPKGAEYAALRCLDLILELAGGELMGPPLVSGEPPMVERDIELSPAWVRERLGFDISDGDIQGILERLELRPLETEDSNGKPALRVQIPSYRQDLSRPIDLVEEVIRHFGSDRIPEGDVRARVTLREDDPVPVYQREATRLLTGKGFQETVHYTLREADDVAKWGGEQALDGNAIANPLASDASHLRPSLLAGLLDCLKLNDARHTTAERLFECGRVFRHGGHGLEERFAVAFVVRAGTREVWKAQERPDYYVASGLALDLLDAAGLTVNRWQISPADSAGLWQDGQAGQIVDAGSGFEARFGLLSPAFTRACDIDGQVVAGELSFLPGFFSARPERPKFKPFSLNPPALRDVAVLADRNRPAADIERLLGQLASEALPEGAYLERVQVFDVYRGQGVEEGSQSVACNFVFRHPERTLNDKEVNEAFQQVLEALGREPGLKVR